MADPVRTRPSSAQAAPSPRALVPDAYRKLRCRWTWKQAPITLFVTDEELAEGQVGYSVDPDGNVLDQWQPQWLVVGNEDYFGEPIFIDVSNAQLPVFTAPHGRGVWEPHKIARSFFSLIQTITAIEACLTEGASMETTLEKISRFNRDSEFDLDFWSVMIEPLDEEI